MRFAARCLLTAALLLACVRVIAPYRAVRTAGDGESGSVSWRRSLSIRRRRRPIPSSGAGNATHRREADWRRPSRRCGVPPSCHPAQWRYHLELARTRELRGRTKEAEAAYLEALDLNPHSGDYQWQVGSFYLRAGDEAAAARYFGTAVSASQAGAASIRDSDRARGR